MTLLSILSVCAALVLFTVLGSLAALTLDLWDRTSERRAERRRRREQLGQIVRR